MILGYHLIFGAYGFWLPNDPRGSGSNYVGSDALYRFGPATKTTERHSVAHRAHDRERRLAAKQALKYPPVQFTGLQARAIGRGFATSVRRGRLTVWACSILPDHVHLVIARHPCPVKQITVKLKQAATESLLAENLHPMAPWRRPDGRVPHCWGEGCWKVYLNSVEAICRAIRYVERNPLREGKPLQRWSFVMPYVPIGTPG